MHDTVQTSMDWRGGGVLFETDDVGQGGGRGGVQKVSLC